MDKEKQINELIALLPEKRKKLGISRAKMGELLEIPARTLQDWEIGNRKPPLYVVKLIIRELDRLISDNEEKLP